MPPAAKRRSVARLGGAGLVLVTGAFLVPVAFGGALYFAALALGAAGFALLLLAARAALARKAET